MAIITIAELVKARQLHRRREFQGLEISVENQSGSYRHWQDRNGESGKTKMLYDYGYIRGSLGADGDHVDVYVGPNSKAEYAYIIDQNRVPDFVDFDEQKVMIGWDDPDEAKKAYLAHYNNPKFFRSMKAMPMDTFREKVLATRKTKLLVKATKEVDFVSLDTGETLHSLLFDRSEFPTEKSVHAWCDQRKAENSVLRVRKITQSTAYWHAHVNPAEHTPDPTGLENAKIRISGNDAVWAVIGMPRLMKSGGPRLLVKADKLVGDTHLVHEIFEDTVPDFPVVTHVFTGKDRAEAQGYFEAHMTTDKFMRAMEADGKYEGITGKTKKRWVTGKLPEQIRKAAEETTLRKSETMRFTIPVDLLIKGPTHKYKSRKKVKGKWHYEYADDKGFAEMSATKMLKVAKDLLHKYFGMLLGKNAKWEVVHAEDALKRNKGGHFIVKHLPIMEHLSQGKVRQLAEAGIMLVPKKSRREKQQADIAVAQKEIRENLGPIGGVDPSLESVAEAEEQHAQDTQIDEQIATVEEHLTDDPNYADDSPGGEGGESAAKPDAGHSDLFEHPEGEVTEAGNAAIEAEIARVEKQIAEDQARADAATAKIAEIEAQSAEPTKPPPTPPKGTPRGDAETETKRLADEGEYINARASAIRPAGEHVHGSAKQKALAWKSLRQALVSENAEAIFTRKFLEKQHPIDLVSRLQAAPQKVLGTLMNHFALRKFPAKPPEAVLSSWAVHTMSQAQREQLGLADTQIHAVGSASNTYQNWSPEQKNEARVRYASMQREQYYEAYIAVKELVESVNETDPFDAQKALASGIRTAMDEMTRKHGFGSTGREMLRKTYNGVVGRGKNSPVRQANDFVAKLKKAYPELSSQQMLKPGAEHAMKIFEGKSMNAAFGTVLKKEKGFNVADHYNTGVMQRKGPESEYKNPQQGMDLLNAGAGGPYEMHFIDWGNSVTDKEREHHLKSLVDSFHDLTDALGLPPRMASFNGKLTIAVGARGRAGALAHYEPDSDVINLTRANGAGALAHEWGHLFDFTLGKITDGGEALSRRNQYVPGTSPTHDAFNGLRDSPTWLSFRKRLRQETKRPRKPA